MRSRFWLPNRLGSAAAEVHTLSAIDCEQLGGPSHSDTRLFPCELFAYCAEYAFRFRYQLRGRETSRNFVPSTIYLCVDCYDIHCLHWNILAFPGDWQQRSVFATLCRLFGSSFSHAGVRRDRQFAISFFVGNG